jgi:hypothetical protein
VVWCNNIKIEKYVCIYIIMYKLRDWVDKTRLTTYLSRNERAIEYLEQNEHLISDSIFANNNAIHIIEKRIENYSGSFINYNKEAIHFLRNNRKYIDYRILCGEEHGIEFIDELICNNKLKTIDWGELSSNPAAMHILNDSKYYNKIAWYLIPYNRNARTLIENNLHKMDYSWNGICSQPHLIDIIVKNMDKINWDSLSENYNAIHILEKNIDKINWYNLSGNHNAIPILEKNIDKININNLCNNKHGFKLLLHIGHVFDKSNFYHKNIIYEYFDYCENNNIPFNLVQELSEYGYTEKHMEFLKNNHENIDYYHLSENLNIFEYDYKRMRETRQSLLWYNDIKK